MLVERCSLLDMCLKATLTEEGFCKLTAMWKRFDVYVIENVVLVVTQVHSGNQRDYFTSRFDPYPVHSMLRTLGISHQSIAIHLISIKYVSSLQWIMGNPS